jgi:hypothetical protein
MVGLRNIELELLSISFFFVGRAVHGYEELVFIESCTMTTGGRTRASIVIHFLRGIKEGNKGYCCCVLY